MKIGELKKLLEDAPDDDYFIVSVDAANCKYYDRRWYGETYLEFAQCGTYLWKLSLEGYSNKGVSVDEDS